MEVKDGWMLNPDMKEGVWGYMWMSERGMRGGRRRGEERKRGEVEELELHY